MKLAVFAVLLMMIIPFQAEAGACKGKDVTVWVAYGYNLRGDHGKSPDPYVVVKIGGVTKKSSVIQSKANPSWWDKLNFKHVTSNTMIVQVWDADTASSDDLLKQCSAQMASGKVTTVKCKTGAKGYVDVYYKCK